MPTYTLFVGGIGPKASLAEIEAEFMTFGKCICSFKVRCEKQRKSFQGSCNAFPEAMNARVLRAPHACTMHGLSLYPKWTKIRDSFCIPFSCSIEFIV